MSFLKQIKEWLDHLRGKGPAAAVALTIDLGEARDNKGYSLEAGAVFVERCDGDLYARVNGPNGDGINLRYVKKILYPVTSLYLTNEAQAGKSARLLLLPTGMDADPPAPAAAPVACECGATNDATVVGTTLWPVYGAERTYADGATILSVSLTVTARTTFVVVAGLMKRYAGVFQIERPVGTNITDQFRDITSQDLHLYEIEACETLDAGSYTWFLVNRSAASTGVFAAWLLFRAVG